MKYKFVLFILIIAILAPSSAMAQEPDTTTSGQQINLPIHFSRCNNLHFPVWNMLWSIITAESDTVVYFINRHGDWQEYQATRGQRCVDLSAYCWITDGCPVVQVVIDDPYSSHCWKSDFALDYEGGYKHLRLWHYSDAICAPDIVRP